MVMVKGDTRLLILEDILSVLLILLLNFLVFHPCGQQLTGSE